MLSKTLNFNNTNFKSINSELSIAKYGEYKIVYSVDDNFINANLLLK